MTWWSPSSCTCAESRATGAGGRARPCSRRRARDQDRQPRQVPLDDVRSALRRGREAHPAEAGVAPGMHQDQPDERGTTSSTWMTAKTGSIGLESVARRPARHAGGVEDRPDEVAGDLILRHVARRAGGPRPRDIGRVAAEPVSTTTARLGKLPADRLGGARSRPCTGMAISINTTSGASFECELDRLLVRRRPGRRPRSARRVARITSSASAKSARRRRSAPAPFCPPSGIAYAVDETEARAKIHNLLLTGDNRLKQGVSLAKVRESYEQALEVAEEHGLERLDPPARRDQAGRPRAARRRISSTRSA